MNIGLNHIHFKTINSTNLYAIDLLSKTNPSHGTVISSDFQSEGKGQIGRNWQSEPDQNIALSIILYPHFLSPQHQFALSKAIALGIVDFLMNLRIPKVSIKWPNDIYIDDNKVCGILIQNILSGNIYKVAIVGIGLNVLQTDFNAVLTNPTSLKLNGFLGEIDKFFYEHLFKALEVRYKQLKDNELIIHDDYQQSLYRIGTWNKYCEVDEYPFRGKFLRTDPIGRMILEKENGEEYYYSVGEIKMLI